VGVTKKRIRWNLKIEVWFDGFHFPGDNSQVLFQIYLLMTLQLCLNLEATTTTRKIDHIFYLPFAGAIAHNFIPHPKTISAEPSTF